MNNNRIIDAGNMVMGGPFSSTEGNLFVKDTTPSYGHNGAGVVLCGDPAGQTYGNTPYAMIRGEKATTGYTWTRGRCVLYIQPNNTYGEANLSTLEEGLSINPDKSVFMYPPASVDPAENGQMTFELTSDTELTIKVKGSDGVIRSATLPLA
jgi:hypothetical protein